MTESITSYFESLDYKATFEYVFEAVRRTASELWWYLLSETDDVQNDVLHVLICWFIVNIILIILSWCYFGPVIRKKLLEQDTKLTSPSKSTQQHQD